MIDESVPVLESVIFIANKPVACKTIGMQSMLIAYYVTTGCCGCS